MHEEDKSKDSTFPHCIFQLNSRLNFMYDYFIELTKKKKKEEFTPSRQLNDT